MTKYIVKLNAEVYTKNLVKWPNNLNIGATINRHKPPELNMEFDVNAPSKRHNITC